MKKFAVLLAAMFIFTVFVHASPARSISGHKPDISGKGAHQREIMKARSAARKKHRSNRKAHSGQRGSGVRSGAQGGHHE